MHGHTRRYKIKNVEIWDKVGVACGGQNENNEPEMVQVCEEESVDTPKAVEVVGSGGHQERQSQAEEVLGEVIRQDLIYLDLIGAQPQIEKFRGRVLGQKVSWQLKILSLPYNIGLVVILGPPVFSILLALYLHFLNLQFNFYWCLVY